MHEEIELTGIVLYATVLKEYDKRLVVLTKERGKVTIFANGARKPNSMLRAASQSFVMGTFTVRPGREAYNLVKVEVQDYFSELQYDIEKMCYASYCSEFMSYYTREGDRPVENLNLMYVTLKAFVKGEMPNELIKRVFEMRLMDIEGQGMQSFGCAKCGDKELVYFDAAEGGMLCAKCAMKKKVLRKVSPAVIYTMQFILSAPLGKLYSFNLADNVKEEFDFIVDRFRKQYIEYEFKSLSVLPDL